MSLEGRQVLVTGASSGIGRATSILASRLGGRLILSGRSEQRLQETLDSLEGDDHHVAAFDFASEREDANDGGVEQWLLDLVSSRGPLHGVVHCAGIQLTLPLRATTRVKLDDVVRVNVTSAFQLSKAFRQRRVRAERGSMVLMASIMGLVGQPGLTAYAASKAALIGLTKSAALEYARENLRINCVAPGHVNTPMAEKALQSLSPEQVDRIAQMHPLGLGEASDVANAAVFLVSDAARWITGSVLVVDGGYTAM